MYIGPKKVKHTEVIDGRVNVVFEDDSRAAFTQKMYDASVSIEPLDATKLQERRILAVQAEIMTTLLEWDMGLPDIFTMLSWINNYLNDQHERADEKLWGNTNLERTIGDINRVLHAKQDGSDSVRGKDNPAPPEGTVAGDSPEKKVP